MKTVYLGLGSNIGDRAALLRLALDKLNTADLRLVKSSGLYETEPVGLREQAWFLNMAAEFETELFPRQLLQRIQRIELELGRTRTVVNGPRKIDIDILFYGNSAVQSADLEIPHPRMKDRRFVLEPLVELCPKHRDPVSRRTVAEMLKAVAGQTVRRLDNEPA